MRTTVTMPIETLAFIIAKARELESDVDDDEAETETETETDDDEEELSAAEGDDEEGAVEDWEDDELTGLLGSLSDDELAQLLALIWVGAGDYGEGRWDEALSRARAADGEDVLQQILSADDLGDLIEDGLIELGYAVRIE